VGGQSKWRFEFTLIEISVLPTLTTSQELKNWYFTMKFLSHHHVYVNNTCTKFQGQKIHPKKDVQNLPTCVVVKQFHYCQLWHPPKGWKIAYLLWLFFMQDHFYVNNISAKLRGQKIHTQKDIRNLSTCVVVREILLLPTLTLFQRLRKNISPWIFFHEIISVLITCVTNFIFKIITHKKII